LHGTGGTSWIAAFATPIRPITQFRDYSVSDDSSCSFAGLRQGRNSIPGSVAAESIPRLPATIERKMPGDKAEPSSSGRKFYRKLKDSF
jgi:hypothetical protein